MNRTIKHATVKRFYYETHDQLRSHLADFVTAYNFAKRLKTLKGLTPYEYICKLWTKAPEPSPTLRPSTDGQAFHEPKDRLPIGTHPASDRAKFVSLSVLPPKRLRSRQPPAALSPPA